MMNSSPDRKVYLVGGAAICAAGQDIETIWRHLATRRRTLSDLPCPAPDGWPWPQVFTVEEPVAGVLNIDRKLFRTMEKQAKLALYGASLALRNSTMPERVEKSRIGLYLGLPTVDEPVPPWSLLQALHENGARRFDSDFYHGETPPFSGLSQLNSNTCAHIAGTFGMTGAMGAYSPFADAGLQAIVEAAASIVEGENDAALAGGVSPKINPLLLLQHEHFGWNLQTARPGEGAAFVVLDTVCEHFPGVRLSGYARGFIGNSRRTEQARAEVLRRALAGAGIAAADLDWILPDLYSAEERASMQALFGATQLPLGTCVDVAGRLGPAGPVLNLLLALHGMRHRKRLRCDRPGEAHVEEFMPLQHVLVTASGPEGQYLAVILSRELT